MARWPTLVGVFCTLQLLAAAPVLHGSTAAALPGPGVVQSPPTTPPTSPAPTSTPTSAPAPTDGAGDPAREPGSEPDAGSTADPAADPSTTLDPLLDEAPGEEVPEVDVTVPPPGGAYSDQKPYTPQPVLWSSVRRAEEKLAEARAAQEASIDLVRRSRAGLKALMQHHRRLEGQHRDLGGQILQAEGVLRDRAVAAFVSNGALAPMMLGSLGAADHDQVLDLQTRHLLVDAVIGADIEVIAADRGARASIEAELTEVAGDIRAIEGALAAAEAEAGATMEAVGRAEGELAAFLAGSAIYISGVVFPVAEPFSRPLIDSFGFPRMPGTPDEHWHEGIDIFAPAGTPLVATERGVITRVGSGRLGGLTVWLRGESGAHWYYAHLQSHASGLVVGMVVDAGQVVGYVGNTGNAVSTPPHLHLELHPDGSGPVNPYPLLSVVADDAVE